MRPDLGGGRGPWIVLAVVVAAGGVVALAPWRERAPDKVWKEAEDDLKAGRVAEAEQALRRLNRLRAPTAFDEMLAAQVDVALKRPDPALSHLARIPDDHPLAPQARLLAGQVELRRGRVGAAEKALRAAVRLDPRLVQAHRELIYIYGMLLRRSELSAEFTVLSDLVPLTFENLFTWALTRNNKWDPVDLRPHLERFLNAEPDDRATRLALADCLRQLGRKDEAEATLRPLPATDSEARVIRVRLALDRGDDDLAAALLKDGPADHPGLALLRGRLALARGDGAEALRQFEFAHHAQPDDRDTAFGLAGALRLLGREADAEPYLEASRRHDILNSLVQRASTPAGKIDPHLPMELGAASEALGRLRESRGWYGVAIKRDPADGEAQRAFYRVKQAIEAQSASRLREERKEP